jgi:penicillin amidase
MKIFSKSLIGVLLLAGNALTQGTPSPLAEQAQKAFSTISGKLRAKGLQLPVTVLRDRWGVAHIYAQNEHDLFFAQGFVAAQDRLFQMELWKRAGEGRLAEVLGPSALLRDIHARLLRYRGDMKLEYESYSPDTESILRAFTDGINAYIRDATSPGGQPLPLEFQMAGFRPEPWKPQDCLNRMAAFSMTGNAFSELHHAQLVAGVGAKEASRLLDLDPEVVLDPAPGVSFAGLAPSQLKNLVGSDTRIEFPAEASEGSNNWTISGKLTESGKPLLANDPHRVVALPSLRYIVHLVAPGWNVIGAGEPGLPGVALGHNQHIAWGFTIFGLDQQDLYIEELSHGDPLLYKTDHGWEKVQIRREKFGVKGGPTVEVDLKFTRHGPVLWEDGKRALVLRWVGSEPGTAGYLGSLAVDRAQNWQQFEAAMARWKVPSENVVYADTEGNIGEHSTGLAPLRKRWTGLLPVPGASGYEWAGFVPVTELPHQFNPAAGFVATANHKMIPANYAYHVGFEWAPPYRFNRVVEVLSAAKDSGRRITIEDVERLQSDVLSLPARELLGMLKTSQAGSDDPAVRMLLEWNASLTEDSAAAALYEVWLRRLRRAVAQQAVPSAVAGSVGEWSLPRVLNQLSAPTPETFGQDAVAGRDRLIMETLQEAWKEMQKRQGNDSARWSWGQLHTMRFRHPLDQTLGAETLLDLGPVPRPGDGYTVNATHFEGQDFEQESGASYREILDTADWDRSLAVNTPGQSAQPGSPHYSDLLPLWEAGKYFTLLYSREAVEKAVTDRLVLEP